MKILRKVWDFLKKSFRWLFSDWKNLAVVVLGASLLFLYINHRSLEGKYNNQIKKYSEVVSVYENTVGELYVENTAYITDIKNLESLNKDLYDEVKKLKDNPIIVTKYETVTEYRDIVIRDTVRIEKEGVFTTGIFYSDQWAFINGKSTINTSTMISETCFDSISFVNNYFLDLIEDKSGNISFIIKSDNPYSKINNLTGVMLSPEDSKAIRNRYDKKWCIVIGVGPSFSMFDNKPVILPALHITFGRKVFAF